MNEDVKLSWLKRLLIFKILVLVLLWGLPTWLAPEGVLRVFGETLPDPPLYMRIFGAAQIGLVFLYWFAYKDPIKNRDVIRYAVIDNTIAFLTLMVYATMVGITSPLGWLSAGLLAFFAIAFYLLIPKVF